MLKKFYAWMMAAVLTVTAFAIPISTKLVEGDTSASNGWKLVWSDEFNGTELDRSIWNVEVNGYGGWNNELQYYCDSSENIDVSDGTLKITARKKSYLGKEYTSARLNSKDKAEFRFGRIEAKMKLPSFQGAWPAFWMLGANDTTWPECGEIDILETINDESIAYGTAHWQAGDSYESSGSSTLAAGVKIDITQWHTYGIEWDANQIVWYVDDTKYFALDIASDPNRASLALDQYLLLNLAVGGDWPGMEIDDTAIPATMEVDYVRVYEKDNSESEIPTISVKDDSVTKYQGVWNTTVGSWAGAAGTGTSAEKPEDGFQVNLTAVGSDMWGVQASLANLSYRAGNTYTFSCTITSSVDKNAFVKVEGDDYAELAADYVSLKANQPYQYETTVFIPSTYTGSVSLFYALGGGISGEALDASSAMNLSVSNVSFATYTTIPDPDYTEKETTTEEMVTTDAETESVTEEMTTEMVPEETTTSIEKIQPDIEINGYQISQKAEGFRTIYTIHDLGNNVVSSGLIYGLGDVTATDMIVGSQKENVYYYDSTNIGKMNVNFGETDTSVSYTMTMKFIKQKEFYSSPISVRAYAKLSDGTYVYSDCAVTSVYSIADYLYQNRKMNTYNAHMYLYDNILSVVDKNYQTNDYDWGNTIVKMK